MKHRFSLSAGTPGRAFDRHGDEIPTFVGDVHRCSRCNVFEARVRVDVLGRPTFVEARGYDPERLVVGAHARCSPVIPAATAGAP